MSTPFDGEETGLGHIDGRDDDPKEDQPTPPQYVVAIKIEFDDALGPPVLYQVRGRGTIIECHVMAEKVPDFTYNGARKINQVTVVVVEAPELDDPNPRGVRLTEEPN